MGRTTLFPVAIVLIFAGLLVLTACASSDDDLQQRSGYGESTPVAVTTAATATSTPTPVLPPLHETQNTRWLERTYPTLYRQIQELPWVKDGLSDLERNTVDQLVYLGVGYIANLKAVLNLPWVQDTISETEHNVIYWLRAMDSEDEQATASIIAMPFLQVSDTTDVLAIRGMHTLARRGRLPALVDHSTFQDGLTEDETLLVAAAATFYSSPGEIDRILNPGYASIETVSTGTELTPNLKVSIIRTGSQSRPETVDAVANAVDFVERTMELPLPTDHVIVVWNDKAVSSNFGGTNYGFAIGYRPEYEGRSDPFESGLVHEVAHYYWTGNEDWIDEGVAETIEYMYGIEKEFSPGLLRTFRGGCEAYDLKMLSEWNPAQESPQFSCNYYLGELLFQELREELGNEEFAKKLRELYRLSLLEKSAGETPGLDAVQQVFSSQTDIVDKHWSGGLNAPENRPSDEGADGINHDLIQWDQYPTYDGRSVSFGGTLLADAVLSGSTISQAIREGYPNFTLSPADGYDYSGSISPALEGGEWPLDELGDSIATVYQLDDRAFTVEFPFPQALGDPSDYVVVVWGYIDDSRTPRIDENVDVLGYARIRED